MSIRGNVLPSDKANKEIDLLVNQEGNSTCSECGKEEPTWASLEYGVFICVHCSGVFRSMSNSNLKAIRLEDWDDQGVQIMKDNGNTKSNAVYEKGIPDCWVKPSPDSCLLLREQWIYAKYQRKEFTEVRKALPSYLTGEKTGMLFKLKKQGDKWQPRWFVLDKDNLSMFINREDKAPRHEISVLQLNAIINGNFGRMNSMQLITRMEGRTRNIFVYAENGREIIEWYCGIRAAKKHAIESKNPGIPREVILQELSEDFVKTGYLLKTPPGTMKFQKRYFVLDSRRLMYFNSSMDATPLGEIILGTTADKFTVDEECLAGEYSFILHTPFRDFPLIAESQEEKGQWVKAFQLVFGHIMDTIPMSPRARCSTYELELQY